MDRKEFGRQLHELQDIIVFGISCFTAWRGIFDLDEGSAEALNRYRGFFLPAQRSFREMALLQFSKVFDRHRGTVILPNLLRAAKANPKNLVPHAEGDDLESLGRSIDRNRELLKRLKDYRDQRLAHHDQKATKGTSVLHENVKQLVADIIEMYNSLGNWHDGSTTLFDSMSSTSEHHTAEVKRLVCEERDRAQSISPRSLSEKQPPRYW